MSDTWLLCEPLSPIKIEKEQLIIGRDNCDVILPHRTVSRSHAVIKRMGDNRFVICDLASSNGTVVNNKKITRHILKIGDEIQIGTFTLQISDSPKEFSAKTDFFTASKQFSVVGQLEKTSLVEMLQSIEFYKKTGTLIVQHEDYGEGTLIFGSGRPICAEFRGVRGVMAIYEMLHLKKGYFMTTNDAQPSEKVIDESFTNILLNYLRVIDERKGSESTWFS